MVALLGDTLQQAGFAPTDKAAVLAAVEARRALIVGEGGSA